MKPLIPYVGTNNYAKESFEAALTNAPSNNILKTLFAEASTAERCNFLEAVSEMYNSDCLTKPQALHLISLVEKADDLIDTAYDYIEFCENNDVDLDVVLVDTPYYAERVMTRSNIIDSLHDGSMYTNQLTKNRTFKESTNGDNDVFNAVSEVYEDALRNLENYKSGNKSTFDIYKEDMHFDDFPEFSDLLVESINADACKGVITPENASVEKSFCIKAFENFNVASMLPEAPLTGDSDDPNEIYIKSDSIEDILKSDDAEIDASQGLSGKEPTIDLTVENAFYDAHLKLMESQYFTALEAAVPKNNVTFDSEAKKLFAKIKTAVNADENPDDYLQKALNVSKNRYTFNFKDDSPMGEDQIRSILLMLKYVPRKENTKILDYSKKVGDITITLTFDSMQSGISMSYSLPQATKESADEIIQDQYLGNKKLVANMVNSVIESVTYGNEDFMTVTENSIEHYLEKELMNESSPMYESAKALYAYCNPERNPDDNIITENTSDPDRYALLGKIKGILESVMESRYACYTVLNEAEFMEAEDEDIDDDIKPTIDLLNKLGYGTKYSCSGHSKTRISDDNMGDGIYKGKLYSTARITFDRDYKFKIIPRGWYQNPNMKVSSIYVEPLKYNPKDGSPDEAFKKWKEGYMTSLKAWVEDLKTAKENNSDAMVESIISDLEKFGMDFLESGSGYSNLGISVADLLK